MFFNHFVRVYVRLSIGLVAQAWNRGAALMCKPCTDSIDFVIPVMLAQPKMKTNFGPIFGDWTNANEIEEGCRWMSFILINSKNYQNSQDHETAAYNISLKNSNFRNKTAFDRHKNIYLSILQDFGPEINPAKEPVRILSGRRGLEYRQQIPVILSGHGGETYNCLADVNHLYPDDEKSIQRRQLTKLAIRQLKKRVDKSEAGGYEDTVKYVSINEGFFGRMDTKGEWLENWRKFAEGRKETEDVSMVEANEVNLEHTHHSLDPTSESDELMDMA